MSGSGAIRALAKEKHVRAVVRQYLIYHDMHKTVRHFDGESGHSSTVAISMTPDRARKVPVGANQSNHGRVGQFSCFEFEMHVLCCL